jgi:hypothetical protein
VNSDHARQLDGFVRAAHGRSLAERAGMTKSIITLALGLSLVACGGKSDESSNKTSEPAKEEKKGEPEKKAEKKPEKKPEPPKSIPVTIDPEIAKLAKEIVANCEIDEKGISVSGCKGNEEYAIPQYASNKEATGVYESLAELALTEGAKDKKLFAGIVATWNLLGNREMQKKASTPAAAQRVITLFGLVPDHVDRFGYAAAIPLAAGMRTELVAALGKLKPDSKLREASLKYLLDFGGVEALPDVQAAYKEATGDGMRYAATWSVGIALYRPGASDEARTKMCDWVKSVAADTAAPARGFAGAVESLGRCKGTYIDDALAAIEARLAGGKLTDDLANALHHMCWAEGVVGGTPNGSPEQCERTFGILSKAVAAPDVPANTMTSAIYSLAFVAKNAKLQAKAKPILTTLSTNKDKNIADAAKRGLQGM